MSMAVLDAVTLTGRAMSYHKLMIHVDDNGFNLYVEWVFT